MFRIVHIWILHSERLNHIGGYRLLMMHVRHHVLRGGYDLSDRRFLDLPLRVDQKLGHRCIVLRLDIVGRHRVRGRCARQLLRLTLLRVRIQRTSVVVPLRAELARIRPLTGMRIRVLIERGETSEGLGTNLAVVLRLAGMHGDVPRQSVGPCERSTAILTDVRFLAAVSPHVQLQIRAFGERTAAYVAHIRFDAGVRTHMRNQRATLSETLAAHFTEEPLLRIFHPFVPLHMVRQRLGLRECLRTERAFVRSVMPVLQRRQICQNVVGMHESEKLKKYFIFLFADYDECIM